MNKEQEEKWNEAQKISTGEDLIEVAQRQLEFLAAVDRQRWLYNSPGLERAIYRYKACWLPLLAKHSENADMKGPLVVPLDCEWIWHCHRLNPLQYKMDCERVYGRILDCKNVESSIRDKSKKQSEEIWERFYPDEPFELDYNKISFEKVTDLNAAETGGITYDLVAAVQRQSSFYYQVARPSTEDPRFLFQALTRYKGFLYLIKSNYEKSNKSFSVPTYDIDIMWHSHQLCPVSYCNDMVALLGMVVQHDDNNSDKSIGNKMYDGFIETTKQFEETFGLRYWRAGTMYRGSEPTALTMVPASVNQVEDGGDVFKSYTGLLSLPRVWIVQIFLEIVDVKDAPINESETVYVSFTKNQHDMHFSGNGTLSIQSLTGMKNVASFECEPTGDITLTLIATSNSNSHRILGTTAISLKELTDSNSKLFIENWFELKSDNSNLRPTYLRVAASSTVPEQAPFVVNMVRSDESFFNSVCGLFSFLCGKKRNANYWARFLDCHGEVLVSVQMRYVDQHKDTVPECEVLGVTTQLKKPFQIAVKSGNKWSFNEICKAEITEGQDGDYLFELKGDLVIKLYWGERLEFEGKHCKIHNEDGAFVTAVQFSKKHPYGKAIALLDMQSNLLKINNEWFVLPWITLSSIIMHMLRRETKIHTSKKGIVTKDTNTPCNMHGGPKWFDVLAGKDNNCTCNFSTDGISCITKCLDSLPCESGTYTPNCVREGDRSGENYSHVMPGT